MKKVKKVLLILVAVGLIFSQGARFNVNAGDEYLDFPTEKLPIPPQ